LFLAGPFLWLVYFQVSSSAAAMSCAPDLLGVGVWSFVGVVGATVLGVGMYSRRSLRGRLVSPAATKQALAIGGSLLGASILFGLPLLFSQPC
jgi:hypothetical protein